MVSVFLDCKIEMPCIDDITSNAVKEELQKELQIIAQELSEKATKSLRRRFNLKIYNQGA